MSARREAQKVAVPGGGERSIAPAGPVGDGPGGATQAERDVGITVACSGCFCHHCGAGGRSSLCHAYASPRGLLTIHGAFLFHG